MNGKLFDTPDTYRDEFGRVHETPYAGTSGWSGSATSRDRAIDADSSGVTGKRQSLTLDYLADADTAGLTWKELADVTGWHHGTASGVLSVLHKTGHIARLKQTRDRCRVYVTTRNVLGRETETHGRTKEIDRVQELLETLLRHNLPNESREAIEQFLAQR